MNTVIVPTYNETRKSKQTVATADLIGKQREVTKQAYAILREQMKALNAGYHIALANTNSKAFRDDLRAQKALETYRRESSYLDRLVHPERASEVNCNQRKNRPEAVRESERKWLKANPSKITEYNNRRRARLAGASGNFTAEEFDQLCQELNYRCAYCSKLETEVGSLVPDHCTPISRGGSDSIDNILPACKHCNSSKGDKTLEEFLQEEANA